MVGDKLEEMGTAPFTLIRGKRQEQVLSREGTGHDSRLWEDPACLCVLRSCLVRGIQPWVLLPERAIDG